MKMVFVLWGNEKMNELVVKSTLEALAKQFNVTVEYLVPKMRDYKMAMDGLGFLIAGSISLAILIGFVYFFVLPAVKDLKRGIYDQVDVALGAFMFITIELIPAGFTIYFMFDYIGWKYAPEMKLMEYVVQMIK